MPPIAGDSPAATSLTSHDVPGQCTTAKALREMEEEIQWALLGHVSVEWMLRRSADFQEQYKEKLEDSPDCMLPSYCHTLPTGDETGTYLAVDVGGSTLRVALVELNGRRHGSNALCLRHLSVAVIDDEVKKLSGTRFFDWVAAHIWTMLAESCHKTQRGILPLGMAWSFPIEQTSQRTGVIRDMGKGFNHHDTMGYELNELLTLACQRRNMQVRVDAIINDSSAALLCRAYTNPSTSVSLIVGTGINATINLPVSSLGREKFGLRDVRWYSRAEKVITNTELSMFGKNVLPDTKWDELLNRNQSVPDFQPLEYKTTGMYLGEILRLIILDAVPTRGLFSGVVPEALQRPYSISTTTLAALEDDHSPSLRCASLLLQREWGLVTSPSVPEIAFLKSATEAISHRASAYLAIVLHALLVLQRTLESASPPSSASRKTTIACCGSIILKYPGFRRRCQEYMAQMFSLDPPYDGTPNNVLLEPVEEAAILGAAVAVALADTDQVTQSSTERLAP